MVGKAIAAGDAEGNWWKYTTRNFASETCRGYRHVAKAAVLIRTAYQVTLQVLIKRGAVLGYAAYEGKTESKESVWCFVKIDLKEGKVNRTEAQTIITVISYREWTEAGGLELEKVVNEEGKMWKGKDDLVVKTVEEWEQEAERIVNQEEE